MWVGRSQLLFQCSDFLLHLVDVAVFHIRDIDYHIDLICPVRKRLAHLRHLRRRHAVAQRKADYRTDIDLIPIGVMHALDIARSSGGSGRRY